MLRKEPSDFSAGIISVLMGVWNGYHTVYYEC
jgi:hypothetical protein